VTLDAPISAIVILAKAAEELRTVLYLREEAGFSIGYQKV
jgi:hypothetical protein